MATEPTKWEQRLVDCMEHYDSKEECIYAALDVFREFAEEMAKGIAGIEIHRPEGPFKFPSEIKNEAFKIVFDMLPKKEG